MPQFPAVYGFDTVILDNTSPALLDLPSPDFLSSIQQNLNAGEPCACQRLGMEQSPDTIQQRRPIKTMMHFGPQLSINPTTPLVCRRSPLQWLSNGDD